MSASSSAINPTQDFLARMGSGRLFEMGASTVKYGTTVRILYETLTIVRYHGVKDKCFILTAGQIPHNLGFR